MSHKRLFALLALPALLITLQAQPAFADYTVRCDSNNRKHNTCNTNTPGRFRAVLVQQKSDTKCIQGSTWGQTDTGVWVDHGCSGVFSITQANNGGRFNRDHRGHDDHHEDHGPDRWHNDHHDDHHH